jgi:hypothetical protein
MGWTQILFQLIALMSPPDSAKYFGTVTIQCVEADPTAPNVRKFFSELNRNWPLWIRFINLDPADPSFEFVVRALCKPAGLGVDQRSLAQFIRDGVEAVATFSIVYQHGVAPELREQVRDYLLARELLDPATSLD